MLVSGMLDTSSTWCSAWCSGDQKNSQGTVGMVSTEKHHTEKHNISEKSV